VANYSFNLGSTQQLAKFLFDDLGLAAGKRTKTGRSTDANTLEGLRDAHPAVNLILEWRQLTKLKSTYVDTLPLLCDAKQRVHTSFNQAVAATGRLSSSDPNLQNIPIRSEWGQKIRAAFVPAPGCSLISADYSQIELRVLAHLSGDTALIEAFKRGDDIHALTAARVFGVDIDNVSKEQRRHAKVVNFGIVYGLSDFGLAQGTGMTRDAARAFIDAYFANFPQVSQYLRDSTVSARERGYAETLWGRKRWIVELKSPNRQMRLAAERMAVNMPIQGTAADIMKNAMLSVDGELRGTGNGAKLLLQVHDELVLEVPETEVESCVHLLRRCMGNAAELMVPLEVEVKVGKNWAQTIPTVVTEVAEAVDAGVA
jgi:DNA polymerase-1